MTRPYPPAGGHGSVRGPSIRPMIEVTEQAYRAALVDHGFDHRAGPTDARGGRLPGLLTGIPSCTTTFACIITIIASSSADPDIRETITMKNLLLAAVALAALSAPAHVVVQ